MMEPTKAVRQLIFCLTLLFAYSLNQYNMASNAGLDNKNSVVLVEAFTVNEPDEQLTFSSKKFKLDSVDAKGPIVTTTEDFGDMIKHFSFAFKCWNLLHSTELYQKEFVKLKQHIRLDLWLSDFVTDIALYTGRYEEFKLNVYNNGNSVKNSVQKLTCSFITKNYHLLGECGIQLLKQMNTLPTVGVLDSNLNEYGTSRHLHYLPVAKIPILQYIVKLLIIMYWQLLPNFTGFDSDRVYGYLLILCQMSWPTEKKVVFDIISRIRNQRTFVFPLFFKYIVNAEILEEFMYMYINKQETVKLDLMGTSSSPSCQKRISTRGVDKEEREDFMLMMKKQIRRHEPLYLIIMSFLLEEERFISLN